MKAAVVFFSRAGENFINGKTKKIAIGNTVVFAQKVAALLDTECIKLKEVERYPEKYEEAVKRAENEKKQLSRITYHPIDLERSEIDALFLGYPNWWGSYPQIIASFLADFNTEGLEIYPFCTHEGSAFGHSLADLRKQCPKAKINGGLPIRGSRVERSDLAIENWLLPYK